MGARNSHCCSQGYGQQWGGPPPSHSPGAQQWGGPQSSHAQQWGGPQSSQAPAPGPHQWGGPQSSGGQAQQQWGGPTSSHQQHWVPPSSGQVILTCFSVQHESLPMVQQGRCFLPSSHLLFVKRVPQNMRVVDEELRRLSIFSNIGRLYFHLRFSSHP